LDQKFAGLDRFGAITGERRVGVKIDMDLIEELGKGSIEEVWKTRNEEKGENTMMETNESA
jgi:hypothetical protein